MNGVEDFDQPQNVEFVGAKHKRRVEIYFNVFGGLSLFFTNVYYLLAFGLGILATVGLFQAQNFLMLVWWLPSLAVASKVLSIFVSIQGSNIKRLRVMLLGLLGFTIFHIFECVFVGYYIVTAFMSGWDDNFMLSEGIFCIFSFIGCVIPFIFITLGFVRVKHIYSDRKLKEEYLATSLVATSDIWDQ